MGTHEIMGNPSPTPTSELEQIHPSVAIDYGAKKRQSPSKRPSEAIRLLSAVQKEAW